MADNPFYNCGEDWEEHTANACFTASTGMDAVYFFKPGVGIADYTTTTDGVTTINVIKMQGLLDTGLAKLVNGLRIGMDAPSAITSDSWVACSPETTVTYDRTLTYKDRKVDQAGVKFYNSINAASGFILGGMLIHECAADRATAIDSIMTFTGGRVSPEGDELQRFEFTVSWKAPGDAQILASADVWDLVPAAASSGV